MTPNDCPFCGIVDRSQPADIVAESERAITFMDINPVTDGHALVVPKAHARTIWDLDADDGRAVWTLAQEVARAMRTGLDPHGLTLFIANEEAGWQDVFHFHVHLVPRWRGDELLKPWRPSDAKRGGIGSAATKIRAALREDGDLPGHR